MSATNFFKLVSSIALAVALAACGSGDFKGSNRKKIKEPAIAQPPAGPTPTTDGNDDGADGNTDASQDGNGEGDDAADGGVADGTTDGEGDGSTNPPITVEEDEVGAIKHVCKDGVRQVYDLDGKGSRVKVEGELCPRAFGKLTVMFVVDFSGSMAEADPRSILSLFSCGRADAARAIINKFKKDMRAGDDVKIGFVSFGNDAKLETAPKPIKDFSANTFNFCGSENENTNYKAAFDKTREALQSVQGNKVVYFISDGLPTIGGNGPADDTDSTGVHKAAGLTAAQGLRAAIEGTTLNAVFLDAGGAGQAAQNYLTQVTNDANRVKLAGEAGQLADKILELSIPKVTLKDDGLTAELSAPGYPASPVKIESFKQDPTKPGTWIFKTETIKLNAKPGQTVENTLKLKAVDDRGTTHEEVLTIKLKST